MTRSVDDHCSTKLHDLVTYRGGCYFLRGFTPMSVTPERVSLLDALTGETVMALVDAVQPTRHAEERTLVGACAPSREERELGGSLAED